MSTLADSPSAPDPTAVRRAPYAANPQVGARGQRTRERILDAALEVIDERGYHRSGIDAIATEAGCSRATVYQYFADKEDVFGHLAGRVAHELTASARGLGPVTEDADGWSELRGWVGRYADIYDRHQAVFQGFPSAAEHDDSVATGSRRWSERSVSRLASKIHTERLEPSRLRPVLSLFGGFVARTHDMARIMREALPGHYHTAVVSTALTDVMHRSLFGVRTDVNVHPGPDDPPPALRFEAAAPHHGAHDGALRTQDELTPTGRATLNALLTAGRRVFVERGYHATRVDDIVAQAGVSHGAFYRYFDNKLALARVLHDDAVQSVASVFTDIPPAMRATADPDMLRDWLRRYDAAQLGEAAMLRVWTDASLDDPALRSMSTPALDWGRRVMASFLADRDLGDSDISNIEIDGLLVMAMLSAFGHRARTPTEVDAAAHLVLLGFLGVDTP